MPRMTAEELAHIRRIHDKLDALDAAGKYDEAEAFFKKHRPAFDYDRNGNFDGATRNENGWTP
jgi:hypothetical protein